MGSKKKKFGDRKDAYRVRELNGLEQILIDLKPKRSISDVYINEEFDMTKLCEYIEKKKASGSQVTYFHAFVTAIGKLFYNRNKMNRFVANRHVYEHKDVVISFVAKVSFDDKSEEIMVLVPIEEKDNIDTISKKIKEKVEKIRNNSEKTNSKKGANSAIDFLGKLPNFLRVPLVGAFKWCDDKGILPSSLVEDNIYYSSIIVSNLGSIGCDAIFHNITDFGTCSGIITMGKIEKKVYLNEEGKKAEKIICPFGVNLDERVADGYYYAKSLKMMQYILDNPELLEGNASDKINMDEIK